MRAQGAKRNKVEHRQREARVYVMDEFHFNSVDEVIKRWPDELWAAKGKPKLWVEVHKEGDMSVWRDVAYGGIKLRTSEGVSEGYGMASVKDTLAISGRRTLEVTVKTVSEALDTNDTPRHKEISPDADTLNLECSAEFIGLTYEDEYPSETETQKMQSD
jgi:hypothetical protein